MDVFYSYLKSSSCIFLLGWIVLLVVAGVMAAAAWSRADARLVASVPI